MIVSQLSARLRQVRGRQRGLVRDGALQEGAAEGVVAKNRMVSFGWSFLWLSSKKGHKNS